MYCIHCGAHIKDQHQFCTNCGNPRPTSNPGPRGSRRIPLLIAALMFLVGMAVYGFFQFV